MMYAVCLAFFFWVELKHLLIHFEYHFIDMMYQFKWGPSLFCVAFLFPFFLTGFPQVRKKSGKSENTKKSGKVSKSLYRSGNFEIHLKVRKNVRKNGVDINMNPSFQIFIVRWCHDLFAQCHKCQLEMQENWEMYFHIVFGHFCKSSHNLVGMAHRNDKSYVFCQMITAMIILHLCDACEFLRSSKYHILGLLKVSKNWHLVRKKPGKSQEISLLVIRGNPAQDNYNL